MNFKSPPWLTERTQLNTRSSSRSTTSPSPPRPEPTVQRLAYNMFTVQPSNLKQTHFSKNRFNNRSEKCGRCLKSVYAVEEIKVSNKSFHKTCLRCNSCNKPLEKNSLNEHENGLYCTNCYSRNFGPKAYGTGILLSNNT